MAGGLIVCDSGPLISSISVREQRRHEFARTLIASLRGQLVVPWPVYTELDLFARRRGFAEAATRLGSELQSGALALVDVMPDEHRVALDLLSQYEDLGIDLPDASVMAVAIRAGASILTWDFRHFRAVVTSRGVGLRLLVNEGQLPTP